MTEIREHTPVTKENVEETCEYIFAPWVKAMGLTGIEVSEGKASALLPQNPDLQWANGAICGQAIMAAISGDRPYGATFRTRLQRAWERLRLVWQAREDGS